jgi:hypothetical protein
MPTTIGSADVLDAFSKAVSRLGYEPPLDQKSVKRVTVVAVDWLVGKVRPGKRKKPWLYASRASLHGLGRQLRHTRPVEFVSMVDVAVFAGNKYPYETLITAESEAFANEKIKLSSTPDDNGYLWDFYKLLQVPSLLRLFVARVSSPRCPVLEKRIEWLINCYPTNLRHGDYVFSLVIPTSRREWRNICVNAWVGTKKGALKKISSFTSRLAPSRI